MTPIKIDPAWLAAAGATFAAIVALFAAVYGPRMQAKIARDRHITESRRAWMEDLRQAITVFLLSVERVRRLSKSSVTDPDKLSASLDEATRNVALVRLMLDRDKPSHMALVVAMNEAMSTVLNSAPDFPDYPARMTAVEFAAADLLDEAWARVKRGD